MDEEQVKEMLVTHLKLKLALENSHNRIMDDIVNTIVNFGFEKELLRIDPAIFGSIITVCMQQYTYAIFLYMKNENITVDDFLKVCHAPETNIVKAVNRILRQLKE